MKTTFMIVLFSLISVPSFNQSDMTERRIKAIEGQWKLDENGNVIYQRIVDSLSQTKTELFNKAMDYFVLSYGDANSVIQNKDADNGVIIGKGLFKSVHLVGYVFYYSRIDTWHILKIEVKDGKARITLYLTQYDETRVGGDTPDIHISHLIAEQYPINPKAKQKSLYGEAFVKSHIKAMETLDVIEKDLKEGSTRKVNDNW
jgi:hypothetical protein